MDSLAVLYYRTKKFIEYIKYRNYHPILISHRFYTVQSTPLRVFLLTILQNNLNILWYVSEMRKESRVYIRFSNISKTPTIRYQ